MVENVVNLPPSHYRLIEAGGGKVVDNLTNSILTSLTHLFTESRYFEELNQVTNLICTYIYMYIEI